MSGIRLTLREALPFRVSLEHLDPERVSGMEPAEVADIPLQLGNREATVGDLFDAAPAGDEGPVLEIHGPGARLDGIGARMSGGRIEVIGDAGHLLGREMRGGRIRVRGGCGDLAAAGMKAGEIVIDGDAGDRVGAALPGQRRGLRGGTVVVRGRAGARAGERMRRGVLAVEGGAGEGAGARMVAGTIVVRGGIGPGAGSAMKRGTLIVDREPDPPDTFNANGEYDLDFLALVRRELQALSPDLAGAFPVHHRVRRWVGDAGVGGVGEILLWQ